MLLDQTQINRLTGLFATDPIDNLLSLVNLYFLLCLFSINQSLSQALIKAFI